ncbi:MAG TPA: enoyl-CoA hydratase-related protein [Acidimicrobiales bacterium]|nr:enoyl-CoA hydratase-related protein [Acidimicrobiales bacterium]
MADLLVDTPLEGVTRITFNRPATLNAFTSAMLEELLALFGALAHDLSSRVVVLTGAGRAFSSGHDTTDHSPPPWLAPGLGPLHSSLLQNKWWARVIPAQRAMPQPVIAAINGPVAGGALAIALGADLRVAARSARFVNAFHTLGGSGTELGVAWVLQRTIGPQATAEFLFTDRPIGANEAARTGLVLRTVDDEALEDEVLGLAAGIVETQPLGAWLTKTTLWSSLEVPSLEAAIELEGRGQILALAADDATERRQARAEGRPPRYSGR